MLSKILEMIGALLKKAVLITNHVWMAHRGEQSDLIQRIFPLSFIEIVQLHFFDSVGLVVYESSCLVDTGIRSLAYVMIALPNLPKNWKSLSDIYSYKLTDVHIQVTEVKDPQSVNQGQETFPFVLQR